MRDNGGRMVIYRFERGVDGLPTLVRDVQAKKKPQVGCPTASLQPLTGVSSSGQLECTSNDNTPPQACLSKIRPGHLGDLRLNP